MPLLIPILAGVSSFFAGAYIGGVVDNANASPDVVIKDATVSNNDDDNAKRWLIHGAIGLLIFLAWKKLK